MSGDYLALVRHAELCEHFIGMPQRFPIGLAAHDHGNERLVIGFRQCGLLALAQRETRLAVEGVQPFDFYEIEARIGGAFQ